MAFRLQAPAFVASLIVTSAAFALPAVINVKVEGIAADTRIDEKFALCKATADGKSGPSANIRPKISWSAGPVGTKSYAVLVMDPDVPADFTDAGREGRIIPTKAKRQNFFHWALTDIPADTMDIAGGDASVAPSVGRQVSADLGGYVADAKNFGGPCPPWNDKRMHHYHFIVMALNISSLSLPDTTAAKDLFTAASAHSIARGERVGTYTLNPILRKAP